MPDQDGFEPDPTGFTPDPPKSWYEDIFTIPNAIRFGGSALGSVAAGAAASTGVGLLGSGALLAGGGSLGEAGARWWEGKDFDPTITAVEGALNLLPGGGAIPGKGAALRKIGQYALRQAGHGAWQGAVGSFPRKLAEEGTLWQPEKWEAPSLRDIATQTVAGGTIGGVTGGTLGAASSRFGKARPAPLDIPTNEYRPPHDRETFTRPPDTSARPIREGESIGDYITGKDDPDVFTSSVLNEPAQAAAPIAPQPQQPVTPQPQAAFDPNTLTGLQRTEVEFVDPITGEVRSSADARPGDVPVPNAPKAPAAQPSTLASWMEELAKGESGTFDPVELGRNLRRNLLGSEGEPATKSPAADAFAEAPATAARAARRVDPELVMPDVRNMMDGMADTNVQNLINTFEGNPTAYGQSGANAALYGRDILEARAAERATNPQAQAPTRHGDISEQLTQALPPAAPARPSTELNRIVNGVSGHTRAIIDSYDDRGLLDFIRRHTDAALTSPEGDAPGDISRSLAQYAVSVADSRGLDVPEASRSLGASNRPAPAQSRPSTAGSRISPDSRAHIDNFNNAGLIDYINRHIDTAGSDPEGSDISRRLAAYAIEVAEARGIEIPEETRTFGRDSGFDSELRPRSAEAQAFTRDDLPAPPEFSEGGGQIPFSEPLARGNITQRYDLEGGVEQLHDWTDRDLHAFVGANENGQGELRNAAHYARGILQERFANESSGGIRDLPPHEQTILNRINEDTDALVNDRARPANERITNVVEQVRGMTAADVRREFADQSHQFAAIDVARLIIELQRNPTDGTRTLIELIRSQYPHLVADPNAPPSSEGVLPVKPPVEVTPEMRERSRKRLAAIGGAERAEKLISGEVVINSESKPTIPRSIRGRPNRGEKLRPEEAEFWNRWADEQIRNSVQPDPSKPGITIEPGGSTFPKYLRIQYRDAQGNPIGYLSTDLAGSGIQILAASPKLGLGRGKVAFAMLKEAMDRGITEPHGSTSDWTKNLITRVKRLVRGEEGELDVDAIIKSINEIMSGVKASKFGQSVGKAVSRFAKAAPEPGASRSIRDILGLEEKMGRRDFFRKLSGSTEKARVNLAKMFGPKFHKQISEEVDRLYKFPKTSNDEEARIAVDGYVKAVNQAWENVANSSPEMRAMKDVIDKGYTNAWAGRLWKLSDSERGLPDTGLDAGTGIIGRIAEELKGRLGSAVEEGSRFINEETGGLDLESLRASMPKISSVKHIAEAVLTPFRRAKSEIVRLLDDGDYNSLPDDEWKTKFAKIRGNELSGELRDLAKWTDKQNYEFPEQTAGSRETAAFFRQMADELDAVPATPAKLNILSEIKRFFQEDKGELDLGRLQELFQKKQDGTITPEELAEAKALAQEAKSQPAVPTTEAPAPPKTPGQMTWSNTRKSKAPTPAPAPALPKAASLPAELAGAKPRFNIGADSFSPSFADDLDKALFIIAQKTRSKSDHKYLQFVMEQTGMDEASARLAGQGVRTTIKNQLTGAEPGVVRIESIWRKNQQPAATAAPEATPKVTAQEAGNGTIAKAANESPAAKQQTPEQAVAASMEAEAATASLAKRLKRAVENPNPANSQYEIDELLDEAAATINKIPEAQRAGWIRKVLGANKALLTAWDLSAPGRQGKAFIFNKAWWTSLDDMVKAWGSAKAADAVAQSIIEHPSGFFKPGVDKFGKPTPSFAERMGLDLAGVEELFTVNKGSAFEKYSGVGKSSRAHTAFLNKLRSDQFVAMMESAVKLGMDPQGNLHQAKTYAKFINDATGRGSLNVGKWKLERNLGAINDVMFAPKNLSGQIRTWNAVLNPMKYASYDPVMRNQALRSLLAIAGSGLAVGELAKLMGGKVVDDPASSDFRKIRVGDTRIDLFGGYQQFPVAAMKFLMNRETPTSGRDAGRTINFDKGGAFRNRATVAERFFTNRLSPAGSFVWAWMNNREFDGKPFEVKRALYERTAPIVLKDLYELAKDDPALAAIMTPSNTLGLTGTQTYGRN